MLFDALAMHQRVCQHGIELREAPGSLPRNRQGMLSSELSVGHILFVRAHARVCVCESCVARLGQKL